MLPKECLTYVPSSGVRKQRETCWRVVRFQTLEEGTVNLNFIRGSREGFIFPNVFTKRAFQYWTGLDSFLALLHERVQCWYKAGGLRSSGGG